MPIGGCHGKCKVAFANPPTFENPGRFFRPVRFPTFNYATPVMHPPLFLLIAATYIRDVAGCEIQFLDAQAPGLTVEEYFQRVFDFGPNYLVFETCLASWQNDTRVASMVKEKTGCKVIFCGAQLGAVMEDASREPVVDAVIAGEYEYTLAELIKTGCGQTVAGATVRVDGKLLPGGPRAAIDNLDSLPMPDRSLILNRCYYDPLLKNPFAYFLAGRGCIYRCTFCSWPQTFTGNRYRVRSPAGVVAEVKAELARDPSIRSFLFNDDTFTANKENAVAICAGLRQAGVNIPWGCYTRADLDDEGLLAQMRQSGCYLLKVGVESADENILRQCHKGYNLERVEKALRLMKKMGYHVHATFAFGLPGETPATVKKTVAWSKKLSPDTVQFSVAVPYPGTEFYDYLQRNNYLRSKNWADLVPMNPLYDYPAISGEELVSSMRKAYADYYFRLRYIWIAVKRFWDEPALFPKVVRKFIALVWQRKHQ